MSGSRLALAGREEAMARWWKHILAALFAIPQDKVEGKRPPRSPSLLAPEDPDYFGPLDRLPGGAVQDLIARKYPALWAQRKKLAEMVAKDIKRTLRDERKRQKDEGE